MRSNLVLDCSRWGFSKLFAPHPHKSLKSSDMLWLFLSASIHSEVSMPFCALFPLQKTLQSKGASSPVKIFIMCDEWSVRTWRREMLSAGRRWGVKEGFWKFGHSIGALVHWWTQWPVGSGGCVKGNVLSKFKVVGLVQQCLVILFLD